MLNYGFLLKIELHPLSSSLNFILMIITIITIITTIIIIVDFDFISFLESDFKISPKVD